MSEWNEENIREHMFTEVEVRVSYRPERWRKAVLIGFDMESSFPYKVRGDGHTKMRLIKPEIESLKITVEESTCAYELNGGGGRMDLMIAKHNALVDLVEGKL